MDIAEYRKYQSKSTRGSGKSVLESDIQTSILELLEAYRVFHWRNNTGAGIFKNKKTDKERFVRFGSPGSSDIFALKDGIFYAIEVKRPGKKPTEDQEKFLKSVEENGGVGLVAYSIDDVIKGLSL